MLKRFISKHERRSLAQATEQMVDQFFQKTIPHQLADILYLIATHCPTANHVIAHAHKNGFSCHGYDFRSVHVGFDVYKFSQVNSVTKQRERCDCWFELEYCDFIHCKVLDKDRLKGTCENIRRGMCPHVSENSDSDERAHCYVGLLHIAGGSGNKDIVKLLSKLGDTTVYFRSACGLLPLHIAIVKSFAGVIEYLAGKHYSHSLNQYLKANVIIAKREQETGKVIICSWSELKYECSCFIGIADYVNDDCIRQVIHLYGPCTLLKGFLSTNKERLAYRVLQLFKKNCTKCGWYLVVYSVLLNDRDFLRAVLKRGFYKEESPLRKLEYNLLDIAHAFQSIRCFDILKSSTQHTDDLCERMSPYTFLIKFAAASDGMDAELMVQFISKLHTLGHDVNHQDDLKMTPLMHAIELLKYEPAVIHKLLSIGADVNAKDQNGRTPLYIALTPFNSPCRSNQSCGTRGTIKDILQYNPDVKCSSNQNAVYYAADKDLGCFACVRFATKELDIKFKASPLDEEDLYDIEATTYEERFIALSYIALLHEFGFKVTNALHHVGHKDNLQMLSDYFTTVESVPRTLQSLCRLAIRQAYPGRRLHDMMQRMDPPKKIYNYVVKPYILKYVDADVEQYWYSGKRTAHVDYCLNGLWL